MMKILVFTQMFNLKEIMKILDVSERGRNGNTVA